MAWRVDQSVVRGEIDNRTRGRVTGRIWFLGREEPVVLDLEGDPCPDLAGHCLRFTNPAPVEKDMAGFSAVQRGTAGDITAARKVKVPECSTEELMEHFAARTPFPWHWGNALYLEWFSDNNGRVVIESAAYRLTLDGASVGQTIEAVEAPEDEPPRSAAEAEADAEDAR